MTFGRFGLASLMLVALLQSTGGCRSDSGDGGAGAGIVPNAPADAAGAGFDATDDSERSDGAATDSATTFSSGNAESSATDASGVTDTGAVNDASASKSDVGIVGASDAAGGEPCAARAGLLFCDTFESATATPAAPWSTSIIGSGTVSVDSTTPAHSGTKSIHVADGDGDYDTLLVLHDASVLPAPAGRFYFRAFIRLGAPMSAGHNTFILGDVFASPGQGNNLRLGEDYQMLMYTVMGDAHGALSNANYYNDGMLPGVQFSPQTWTCLEVLLDSKKPEIDVWVEGSEIPDLHHTDYPLDDYDDLKFGFEKYAGPALDVWYDDIAIGTQPIGCD
jgi:polysaccharide lyase-like protein